MTSLTEHFMRLERMYESSQINQFFKPEIVVKEGECVVIMEVLETFYHASRVMDESLYFKLMKDAALYACQSVVQDFLIQVSSFNMHSLHISTEGFVRAEAVLTHDDIIFYSTESKLYDTKGRLLAEGEGIFTKTHIPLGEDFGYAMYYSEQ